MTRWFIMYIRVYIICIYGCSLFCMKKIVKWESYLIYVYLCCPCNRCEISLKHEYAMKRNQTGQKMILYFNNRKSNLVFSFFFLFVLCDFSRSLFDVHTFNPTNTSNKQAYEMILNEAIRRQRLFFSLLFIRLSKWNHEIKMWRRKKSRRRKNSSFSNPEHIRTLKWPLNCDLISL